MPSLLHTLLSHRVSKSSTSASQIRKRQRTSDLPGQVAQLLHDRRQTKVKLFFLHYHSRVIKSLLFCKQIRKEEFSRGASGGGDVSRGGFNGGSRWSEVAQRGHGVAGPVEQQAQAGAVHAEGEGGSGGNEASWISRKMPWNLSI